MTQVYTARNYRAMFEDMVDNALWPPDASYDTFATARYPSNQRLKGDIKFEGYADKLTLPLIAWKCVGFTLPQWYTARTISVTGEIEVHFLAEGYESHEWGTTSEQQIMTDCGLASEALQKQTWLDGLPSGPFWIENTSEVTGQAGTVTGVLPVEFGNVAQPEPAPEIGSNVYRGSFTVFITVVMD